jgi:TonB-linked SusC/RagA family outer membrane protein
MKIFSAVKNKPLLLKLALVMKFTILFLFVALQVSANGFGQEKVTLDVKEKPIADVLSLIEKNTHYRFLYNNNSAAFKIKTSLVVQDADLKDVLNKMLNGTNLSYQFMENNLIVIRDDVSLNENKAVVTGTVTGENGVPLSGVSVQIKGTANGTVTNADGHYSINASENDVLVFSYIGYASQETTAGSRKEINITLTASNAELTQVVVIGYGTQRKRDLTGSIAVISGDAVSKLPSTNPVASLQGKVAGLTIINSGQAGSSPTVRIRGVNSTNNADPLYVVDGIQQTNIDYLNQADIETIEVLKDPSSISIYGLQGGNGVIIITTKRAKKGQTTINFQSNTGIQKITHKIDVVDAAGFKKLYSQQIENVGGIPFDFSQYDALGGNTDWQNQVFRNALLTSNSISVSSSTDKSTTYLNIGYSDQDGVEKYDRYQKYVARLNEEIRLTNDIRIGGEVSGFYYNQNPPAGGIENEALWAAPNIPIKTTEGYYYSTPSFQRAQVGNPVAIIDEANGHTLNTGYRATGNVFAEIKFLKSFTWKSTFYTDLSFNQSRGYSPLPFSFINIGEGSNLTDTTFFNETNSHTGVNQSSATYKTFQQDHTLTFDKNFSGGHHITVLAGYSTLYHYSDFINGNRTDTSLNIPNDQMFWYLNIAQASNPGNFGGGGGEDASTSYIGRINYSFKNRYLINATYRRDGTSKFSPSHQWGNFGSVGAGWVVSDENFLQNVKWINFLKLKASWGTVGNGLSIGNYLSYPVLQNSNVAVFGDNIYAAVTPEYIPDPNLHWEVVEGKDAGFELRSFQNRLSVDVDFYDRKTHDILTFITLPNSNLPYFTNLGTIDNKGLEITAGWAQDISKDLRFSVNGNFSVNSNKVLSIGDNFNFEIDNIANNQLVNRTISGYSIGYFYGYVQKGIYQTPEAIHKGPVVGFTQSAKPGDISYVDIDGNDTINQKDRTYLGTPFPKYNFGISISLSYKNFDLAIEGQGVAGNKIYLQRRTYSFTTLNYESNRLNAWKKSGSSNVEPILDPSRNNNYLFSNYWLESGSYFRLRTLQLGYTFKTNESKYIKMLRFYISAQNIKTFTKATGYSPEVPVDNPTSAGADNGTYPLPAIYSIGVNLTL